jgi:hypothetical protein
MEGARPADPTTVYSEGLTGALYLDKPSVVELYHVAWQGLERLALDEKASKELMKTMIGEN